MKKVPLIIGVFFLSVVSIFFVYIMKKGYLESDFGKFIGANKYSDISPDDHFLKTPIKYEILNKWVRGGWGLKRDGNIYELVGSSGDKIDEKFYLIEQNSTDVFYKGTCVTNLGGRTGRTCMALWLVECNYYKIKENYKKQGFNLVNKRQIEGDKDIFDVGMIGNAEAEDMVKYHILVKKVVDEKAPEPELSVTKPIFSENKKERTYLIKTGKAFNIPKPSLHPARPQLYDDKFPKHIDLESEIRLNR